MALRLVKNIDDKAIFDDWLNATRVALHDEGKRINQEEFQPLGRRFSAKNRPSILTKSKKLANGGRTRIEVLDSEPNKPLFKWLHITGTKPHTIRPTKPHGLLVFPIGDRTVFTRKPVRHPGFKPTGNVERIQNEQYPKVQIATGKAGADAINKA